MTLMKLFLTITQRERGASLVEMAILLVLIAVVALVAIRFVGDSNSEMWSEIGSGLDQG